MTRANRRKGAGRDPGGFVALPWVVLDSPAYLGLSHPARSLLIELARQLRGDNNGRLLLTMAHLKPRGWSSNDTIVRAKRELLESGLVYETCKGRRPSVAGWYAVTWLKLDNLDGYDSGAAAAFLRSAYLHRDRSPKSATTAPGDGAVKRRSKNAPLTPSRGVVVPITTPSRGVERRSSAPADGAVEPVFAGLPTPSHGDHLEVPSTAAALP